MPSTRKLGAHAPVPAEWIRAAAEALSAALAGGRLPRIARRSTRRLLAEAFDALENATGDVDLIRRLEAPLGDGVSALAPPALLTRVEARLRGPRARPGWQVGVRLHWAQRTALEARIADHSALHDLIVARIDAVLATFRTRPEGGDVQVRTHRLALESERDDPTLTRG